jgi:heat shock protein HslJ
MTSGIKSIFAAIGAASLLSACAGLPMTTGTNGTTGISGLQGYEWQVQSINGVAVNSPIRPTMLFGTAMNLTGHTSCNTYGSGYVSTGQMLLIKQGFTTKMACDAAVMNQEQRFLKQLANTQMWSIDAAGTLTLTGTAGTIVATHK